MEFNKQSQLESRGPSATVRFSADQILVRQEKSLHLVDAVSLDVKNTIVMEKDYQGQPCAVADGMYIEYDDSRVLYVDVKSGGIDAKGPVQFDGSLTACSFVNTAQGVLVLSDSMLALFSQQDALPVALLPQCRGASIGLVSGKQLLICSFENDDAMLFDLQSHGVEPKRFEADVSGGQVCTVSQSEVLLIGPRMNAISERSMYHVDLRTNIRTALGMFEHSVHSSVPLIHNGELILADAYGVLSRAKMPDFPVLNPCADFPNMKVATQQAYKLAQIVYQRDFYDIYSEFLAKELQNFTKNAQALPQTLENIRNIARGMIGDKTQRPLDEILLEQLSEMLREPNQKISELQKMVAAKRQQVEELDEQYRARQSTIAAALSQRDDPAQTIETDRLRRDMIHLREQLMEEAEQEIMVERNRILREEHLE